MPILLTVSVIPDIDLLLSPIIKHRTITHSLIFYLLVSLPFFVIYLKKTTPYFLALISHSLIGDVFFLGTQLFWPFSEKSIYIRQVATINQFNIILEIVLFIICMVLMIVTKDMKKMIVKKNTSYWLIPLFSVLGPFFLNTGIYSNLPSLLIVPSLIFASIFLYKIIFSIKQKSI